VYKLLDLTVEAYPDGRLEAVWALNASASKVRSRSPQLPEGTNLPGLRFRALLTEGDATVLFHRDASDSIGGVLA
jgi:hypothetical protein